LEGLESYDISLNEIYADKLAINTDYIALKRPPDLFKDDTNIHDEEKGPEELAANSDEHMQQQQPVSKTRSRPRPQDDATEKLRSRSGPTSEKQSSRRSSSSSRSSRDRNGTAGSSSQSRRDGGSGRDGGGGGSGGGGGGGAKKGQLVAGPNSASFTSLYQDEVEEVRDVTELFF
jgi:hypothetical protein